MFAKIMIVIFKMQLLVAKVKTIEALLFYRKSQEIIVMYYV